jgi:hypothetical protein
MLTKICALPPSAAEAFEVCSNKTGNKNQATAITRYMYSLADDMTTSSYTNSILALAAVSRAARLAEISAI